MGEHFDAYIAVDWSARSTPSPKKPGPDAVWIAEHYESGFTTRYFRTRQSASGHLQERLIAHVSAGRRTLVGFDFAFGFPHAFAQALGSGSVGHNHGAERRAESDPTLHELPGEHTGWKAVWNELTRLIHDDEQNRNNRFEVASELNSRCRTTVAEGPFWGHPPGRSYRHLAPRCPPSGFPVPTSGGHRINRLRLADRCERGSGIQSVWKLYGPASVGGQTLLGIPVVNTLRAHSFLGKHSRVWPFETTVLTGAVGTTDSTSMVVFAETWPNLYPHDVSDPIRDRAQVRSVAHHLAVMDKRCALAALFRPPSGLTVEQQSVCLREEAWILGAGMREYIQRHCAHCTR